MSRSMHPWTFARAVLVSLTVVGVNPPGFVLHNFTLLHNLVISIEHMSGHALVFHLHDL